MKKILQLVMLCAGIGVFALSSSCSTEYDATPEVPGLENQKNPLRGDFTAVVEGVDFKASSKYVTDQTVDGVRTLIITGVMDSQEKDPKKNQTITLMISNYAGPNTYLIQSGTSGTYIRMEDNVPVTYLAKSTGEDAYITIGGDAGNVTGSFSFVVAPGGMGSADNITVTSGAFNIPK